MPVKGMTMPPETRQKISVSGSKAGMEYEGGEKCLRCLKQYRAISLVK